MAFALVAMGIVLLVAAIRNTQSTLFTLLKGDFTGSNNFLFWVVSIIIIGAVGYIPKLKPFSVAFLTLVIIALVLTKGNPNQAGGGFFQKFMAAIGSTTATIPFQQVNNPGVSQITGNNPNQATINLPALGLGS
jgi:hypothetical protein